MESKLMRPVVDYAFKALFGSNKRKSKIILIDLLNNILNLQKNNKIKSIQHLNPFNNKEFSEDKLSVLDIKVKTEKDNLIDIEMQINQLDNYRKRSLYYWSKLYAETIHEAEAYETLQKSIIVSILDFNLLPDYLNYHSKFKIKEDKQDYILVDDLELHYLELKKLNDNKNINEINELEQWLLFIKNAGKKEKEDLVKKIQKKNEVINMAGEYLGDLSKEELERQKYLAREKALLDKKSEKKYQEIKLKEAKEKGLEEGMKQGIEEGIEKGIEKGIKKGEIESLKKIILKQLKIKFKDIPDKYKNKIKKMDKNKLDRLAGKIVTISNISELDDI